MRFPLFVSNHLSYLPNKEDTLSAIRRTGNADIN